MEISTDMDYKDVFATLERVCEDNISVLRGPSDLPYGSVANRLLTCIRQIQEHGRALEPVVGCFTAVYHHYDFDEQTPGNGYRTLVKVLLSCLFHIIQKARYVACNFNSAFFRAEHNAAEMEAYSSALCQLRALLHLAQRLINDNDCGQLYSLKDEDLSRRFVQEYSSMHKACFYGRCLGFQFSPALRPFLQTVVISMVSYGETFGKQQSGFGTAALSLLTSGKYVMDPELRGAEFERITQNLDLQFWKSFWNLTESGLLTGFSRMASSPVQVNLTLTLPPVTLRLPLAADPNLTATISPPIAHWGPGPVHMRLISWELREGQDSEDLQAFYRSDPPPISLSSLPWVQKQPPSRWLLIHFHGGGFVAQTSRSHENYLRSWSKVLNAPILSVDYSLSPEAPFPRALEECFYAYCWALNHCHLLGSTAERVCLAGDSAGGNLCITVSMKAISAGIRVPDGIMAAYPATLLTTDASPSRLLTSIDPLLPLSVLAKCLNAYAGAESCSVQPVVGGGGLSSLGRDTAMLLSDLTQGASSWIQSFLDPTRTSDQPPRRTGACRTSTVASATSSECHVDFPEGFKPLRSECLAFIRPTSCPIIRNPFVSPLLAPSNLLRGLPPVHIVASALDALLDDSVMFAKKLRDMNQPVSLTVMEDLPHGFLSLSQLAKETEFATEICVTRIREIFRQENPTCALQKQLDQSANPSG
ncbi:lipase, hormone-sensitive a isoform X2 [Acanthochromis polyacanthus]|uniref:lipase, hormone-sensitive a isoform X2 n=2 Tax=Acanthochromis polyacanthus TaxID=80966 RepID=UPI0022344275|nr:lipase, hormone-sensitive a isoform X2 [Acanthochromis polyacanthus]